MGAFWKVELSNALLHISLRIRYYGEFEVPKQAKPQIRADEHLIL